jgi:hypothetical protein
MRIATTVLFILPTWLIVMACRRHFSGPTEQFVPSWRTLSGRIALMFAGFATLFELGFFYSWVYSGGSPHGLQPPAGIWSHLRPIAFDSFVASLAFAMLGKGRWRLFFFSWALALPLIATILFVLEMD